MAKPFQFDASQPSEERGFGDVMREVFHTLVDHNVVRPFQELCSRNEGVALSTNCVRRDEAMENAYN